MPSNLFTLKPTYKSDRNIFLHIDDSYRRGGTFDPAQLTADPLGNKTLDAGSILLRMANGKVRALPRAKASAVVTIGTTVNVSNAQVFTVGNILSVLAPAARIQLTGTYANTETITITLDGSAIVHTVSNYSNLTALAEAVVLTLNGTPGFASKAMALAENGYLHIYAKDMITPYPISASETSAAGALTVLNAATSLVAGLPIGTISAINVDTGVITLAAGSVNRLPVGMPFGVPVVVDSVAILGITRISKDLIHDSDDIVGYSSGVINGASIPYIDDQVLACLPEIRVA